jgi:hypothetical protein
MAIAGNSVFWWNMGRNIWKTDTVQEEGEDSIHVMLRHTKSNVSRKEKPIGLHIRFGDNISIKKEDPLEVPEFLDKSGAKDRIKAAILKSPNASLTVDELHEKLGGLKNTIRQALGRNTKLFGKNGDAFTVLHQETL